MMDAWEIMHQAQSEPTGPTPEEQAAADEWMRRYRADCDDMWERHAISI